MTKEKSVASTSPSQTSVDRIIKETWGEILEKENQNGFPLGVGLSLPDLSVTPISTVNESTNQMPSSILRGIPSESGSSEVKSSKSVSFKDDLESFSESDTETLTRLLLERLTSADSFHKMPLDGTGQSSQPSKVEEIASTLESTVESSNFPPSLNLLGPGGIEFDVPQGPVRLSAEDLDQLPDMSSSIEEESRLKLQFSSTSLPPDEAPS